VDAGMTRIRLPLRFSLRTFFVLVTLCCAYLGREWQVVQQRKDVVAWLHEHGCPCSTICYVVCRDPAKWDRREPSWLREQMGDPYLASVFLPPEFACEQARIERIFPGVHVSLLRPELATRTTIGER
jgi:hypothetical protein